MPYAYTYTPKYPEEKSMRKVRKETLKEQVINELLRYFKTADKNKLEPEGKLAERMGVSRITVREALAELHDLGYITKRKGKGNYILKSAIATTMRIDTSQDFTTMLETSGFYATQVNHFAGKSEPDEFLTSLLELKEDDVIIDYIQDYYADDTLALVVALQIPEKIFTELPGDFTAKGGDAIRNTSIWQHHTDQDLTHAVINMDTHVNPEINKKFGLAEGTCLIRWRETYYNYLDEPISYGYIYFNPNVTKLNMVTSFDQIFRHN